MLTFDYSGLRLARKSIHLTQTDAADALGCSTATLAAWESGKTDISASKLAKLMCLYQQSPKDLFITKPNRKESLI